MSLALTTKSERHAKKGNIVRMVAMLRFYLKGKEILNVDLDARKLQIFHKSLPPPQKKNKQASCTQQQGKCSPPCQRKATLQKNNML